MSHLTLRHACRRPIASTLNLTTSLPSPSPSTTTTILQTQTRGEATARRLRKKLAIPPMPTFQAAPGTALSSLIFNPPPAAPSVHQTPLKFLPPDDIRRTLLEKARGHIESSNTNTDSTQTEAEATPAEPRRRWHINQIPHSRSSRYGDPLPAEAIQQQRDAQLPPPVRRPYIKRYHLGAAEVDEIRRLRWSDPVTWTRKRLAEKFGCSEMFVGLVARNAEAGRRRAEEVQAIMERWGPKKRRAWEDRQKRKETWGRDD